MSESSELRDDGDEPVPKLPRGRGLKFSAPELFRIGLTLVTLIGVIVLAGPCASGVSNFVTGFDGSGSASAPGNAMPRPGTVDQPAPQQFEQLRPGMTDAEIKAAIERSRVRQQGSAAKPARNDPPQTQSQPEPQRSDGTEHITT